jgi:pimeloyl-ACP methyl ester carboxylesterase
LRAPTLVIRGEHAPLPTRTIADEMPTLMPLVRLSVVAGAGHMGPLTHAAAVSELIATHIGAANAASRPQAPVALSVGVSPISE